MAKERAITAGQKLKDVNTDMLLKHVEKTHERPQKCQKVSKKDNNPKGSSVNLKPE